MERLPGRFDHKVRAHEAIPLPSFASISRNQLWARYLPTWGLEIPKIAIDIFPYCQDQSLYIGFQDQ